MLKTFLKSNKKKWANFMRLSCQLWMESDFTKMYNLLIRKLNSLYRLINRNYGLFMLGTLLICLNTINIIKLTK